jgi:excinuclease UvrABC nuclease subunit
MSDIDIATLPSVALVDRLSAPECEAVYFLLNVEGRPLYIGSTGYLKSRLGCHRVVKASPENGVVAVAWMACDWVSGLSVEADLIWELQPPLNVRGKRTKLHPENYWFVRAALNMPPGPTPPAPG